MRPHAPTDQVRELLGATLRELRDPRLNDLRPWPTLQTAALFRFSILLTRKAFELEAAGRSTLVVRRAARHAWSIGCLRYMRELANLGELDPQKELVEA